MRLGDNLMFWAFFSLSFIFHSSSLHFCTSRISLTKFSKRLFSSLMLAEIFFVYVPLELITSNRDAFRKAGEAFLISEGKTLEPFGLNRRDEI